MALFLTSQVSPQFRDEPAVERAGRNRRTLDLRGQLFTEQGHRHGVGKRRQGKRKANRASTNGSKEGLTCARAREMGEEGGGGGGCGEWSCARLRMWNKRGLTRSQDISLYPSGRVLVSPEREQSPAPASLEDSAGTISSHSHQEIQQQGVHERGVALEREHTPLLTEHTPLSREHTSLLREHTPKEHTPLSREHTSLLREHTPKEHTPILREHTSLQREHTPLSFYTEKASLDNQEGISGGFEPPAVSESSKGDDSQSSPNLNDLSSLLSSMSMDENALDIDHTHLSEDHTSNLAGSWTKDAPLYPTHTSSPGSKNHTHISENSDSTHLSKDSDSTHLSKDSDSTHLSKESDSTHLSEDTDLTNLSVFEVPCECAEVSKEKQRRNGEESPSPSPRQRSQLEGYLDEFHSDITDLSLYRAQQSEAERSDSEICRGNLSLMNGFSDIAVACNGRVFKPTSFSTPFSKTQQSAAHHTRQCSTSHEGTLESTQEWKRGSIGMSSSEMESDFTRLDFSSRQFSTKLESPDSDLTRLDSQCYESPMHVGTPYGSTHIPPSAKSILKHRYPIFYGSIRKNLSKSVTFKLPSDSCDSSIYSCERSGDPHNLCERSGDSVLAMETPKHLWCTLPHQGARAGMGDSLCAHDAVKDTPSSSCDTRGGRSTRDDSFDSILWSQAALHMDYSAKHCACDLSELSGKQLHNVSSCFYLQDSELEGVSVLATETPAEFWNSLPVNFIGNSFNNNY